MVKIRDLGISAIPGTRYDMIAQTPGTTCEDCNPDTTCGEPSGCGGCKPNKDKDKDKDRGRKYPGAFTHAAVAQLKSQLRHQLNVSA